MPPQGTEVTEEVTKCVSDITTIMRVYEQCVCSCYKIMSVYEREEEQDAKATEGQYGREGRMICMLVTKKGKVFQSVKGLVKR